MEEIMGVVSQFIGSVGFPIAVTCFLLWQNAQMNTMIKENTMALVELKGVITTLKEVE